jgi:hypothetical protein
MRKWLIILLAVLGFSGAANAQNFSIRLGPELFLSPSPINFGIGAEVNGKELANFSSTVSLGMRGRFDLQFFSGATQIIFVVGPTVNLEFDRAKGDAYFGLIFGIAAVNQADFLFGFAFGAHYQITPTINLFSSVDLAVVPGTVGFFDMGADFTVSRGLELYGKIILGFGGGTAFGFGGGLKLKL